MLDVILLAHFDLSVSWGIGTFICTADSATLAAGQVTGAFNFVRMASLTAAMGK
jgi:hypothetical protein